MPQLFQKTPYSVQLVPLIDHEGHNVLVVISKGTFDFSAEKKLTLAPAQEPVLLVDEIVREGQQEVARQPADLVEGKPVTEVIVVRPSGDLDNSPLRDRTFRVAIGPLTFQGKLTTPWQFGPLDRSDPGRRQFAGTYDQDWVENRMPVLPVDFDPRYNLAAPTGQRAPAYLSGEETVTLTNVYGGPASTREFHLPGRVVLVAGNVLHEYFTHVSVLDTILIWVDKPQIVLVWRDVIRPRQKIAEIGQVITSDVRVRSARQLYGGP